MGEKKKVQRVFYKAAALGTANGCAPLKIRKANKQTQILRQCELTGSKMNSSPSELFPLHIFNADQVG